MWTLRHKIIIGNGILLPGLALLMAAQVALAQTWTRTSAPTNWWQCIASSADGSKLVAGQWTGGIYVSTNSGTTWTPTTATNEYWTSVASSADGCKLLAAAANESDPGGVFTSTNSGATWVSNSLPSMYWGSAASSADGNTLAVAAPFGGTIGARGAIFTSTNGGMNWTSNTLTNAFSPFVLVYPVGVAASADGKKMVVLASFNITSSNSVFLSTNSGTTWTQETNSPTISGFISPSQPIATSADGTKLVCAQSGVNVGPIYVSTNSGETWNLTSATNNEWGFVGMSAEGNKIMAMAAPEATDAIYVSTDYGNTWTTNGPIAIWAAAAFSADGGKVAAAASGDANYDPMSGPIYVSQSLVAPQMAIAPANGGVQLSWLAPSTNFVLEQSADLANWTYLTNCPVLNLDNLQDEVAMPSTNGAGFYRLKGP